MKIAIYIVVVAIACVAYVGCSAPSLALTPSTEDFELTSQYDLHAALYEDLLIHASYEQNFAGYRINVRRRNADGLYALIQAPNFSVSDSFIPITNGKWLAMIGPESPVSIGILNTATGEVVNMTEISFTMHSARFLDDDTIVFWNFKDSSLTTIGFVDGDWIEVSDRIYIDSFTYVSLNPTANWPGNYFLATDTQTLRIYERLDNASWIVADSFLVTGLLQDNCVAVYNGNDTVFFATADPNSGDDRFGRLSIIKKISGEWTSDQTLLLHDFDITYEAQGGYSLIMWDANTLLFGIPIIRDSMGNLIPGKVFIIQRNDTSGMWSIVKTLQADATDYPFGWRIFSNGNDVVISGSNKDYSKGRFFWIPKCYEAPINVTCTESDLAVNECDYDKSSLYTVNDPQCGPVTSTITDISVLNGLELSVEYSFSRYSLNATCTAQVTCPAPPTVNIPVTTTPTANTSDAYSLYNALSFGSLLLVLVMLV